LEERKQENEMAKYNKDGTIFDAETIGQMMEQRFNEQPNFPSMSDIIGSDWRPFIPNADSAEDFKRQAYHAARKIYNDYGGHLTYGS
jgi:hypothetical protein